jgi:type VI secretion system secreted protein Hcp
MAIEYFLKLDGIQGESLAAKHQNEIELHSWSWGSTSPRDMATNMSAGKVEVHLLNIQKPTDKSSPKLLGYCCSLKNIATGVLTCCKSTGDSNPADFMTIKLTNVVVSSFQTGGSHHDETGAESVSLAFQKVEFDYKIQGKDGTLTAAGTATYDLTTRTSS